MQIIRSTSNSLRHWADALLPYCKTPEAFPEMVWWWNEEIVIIQDAYPKVNSMVNILYTSYTVQLGNLALACYATHNLSVFGCTRQVTSGYATTYDDLCLSTWHLGFSTASV
jgi:hypothetical protein